MTAMDDFTTLHVSADRTKCCGAGMCALNAPEVFDQDPEEGLVVVLDPDPPQELHGAVRDAADLCPSGAITAAVIRTAGPSASTGSSPR